MKYTVRKSIVMIVGKIWMPQITAGMTKELSQYDVDNCRDEDGKITRESVEDWLGTNAGDFSKVADFYASIEDGDTTVIIPWADEESESVWCDCCAEYA